MRKIIQSVAAITIIVAAGSMLAPAKASAGEAAGKQGCYHYIWEDPGACSTCTGSCGSGQKCCGIVVMEAFSE
ncbi:MAG: hypothetical protein JWM95_1063 [Gemmatimonadetes bacterium]|nr:hypothetical protein [Gemmatimonadota bacterium]